MKKLRTYQRGMTLGGLIIVLGFIGILVTFTVRAFPLYNEKFQIVSAMNNVAADPESGGKSETEIQKTFLKNIEATTNIQRFNDHNLKEYVHVIKPAKKGDPKLLQVTYQSTNKLVADLELLMNFDQKIPLQGNAEAE